MKMNVHVKLQTIGILAVLAAVLCFWLAAGSRPALADSGKTGTITVNVEDTDGHAVAGGTLAVYQVATVQDGKFVYTSDFSSSTEKILTSVINLRINWRPLRNRAKQRSWIPRRSIRKELPGSPICRKGYISLFRRRKRMDILH